MRRICPSKGSGSEAREKWFGPRSTCAGNKWAEIRGRHIRMWFKLLTPSSSSHLFSSRRPFHATTDNVIPRLATATHAPIPRMVRPSFGDVDV